jgi:hypothetical protein
MRTRHRAGAPMRLAVALLTSFALLFASTPIYAASVSGVAQIGLYFSQTPSTGFLAGVPLPVAETVRTIFRTSGVLADQVDGIHAKTYTFVASTPQTIDVTALTDIVGGSITASRARLIAIKVKWTTDNVPLLVGAAAATEWTGFLTAGSKLSVFPSTATNDGWVIIAAPQTTGIPISGSSKSLKLDPQGAAGNVDIIIAFCST